MDAVNEKRPPTWTDTEAYIEQLKLDVEKNAVVLATYQNEFEGISPSSDVHQSYMMRKLLSFIASAPAKLLHQLNKHLQGLSREFLDRVRKGLRRLHLLLAGDVIPFEDALGRRFNLPVAYFGHWGFLKPYMVHLFKGLPGEYQIRRGRYQLTTRRTGQIVDETNWKVHAGSNDNIIMSVMSMIPAHTTTNPECPACGIEIIDTSGGDLTCPNCQHTFSVTDPPPHLLVTPSDGDRRPVPMLAQKTTKAPWSSQTDSKIDDEELVDIEYYEDNPSQTNLGVSQLKHVLVQPTNDPTQIIDSIEDLLDQIITASPGLPLTLDILYLHFPPLRHALSLIREEAQRKNELNYLDFKDEYDQFMAHTRSVSRYLQDFVQIQTLRASKLSFVYSTYNPCPGFTKWVANHYGPPPRPFSNNPTPTLPTNDLLILLKSLTSKILCFRLPSTTSIRTLKELVYKREYIPPVQQYLVHRGKALQEEHTIGFYDLGPQYYVYVLLTIWGPSAAKEQDLHRVMRDILNAIMLSGGTTSRLEADDRDSADFAGLSRTTSTESLCSCGSGYLHGVRALDEADMW